MTHIYIHIHIHSRFICAFMYSMTYGYICKREEESYSSGIGDDDAGDGDDANESDGEGS